jgi:hypothetical protein
LPHHSTSSNSQTHSTTSQFHSLSSIINHFTPQTRTKCHILEWFIPSQHTFLVTHHNQTPLNTPRHNPSPQQHLYIHLKTPFPLPLQNLVHNTQPTTLSSLTFGHPQWKYPYFMATTRTNGYKIVRVCSI